MRSPFNVGRQLGCIGCVQGRRAVRGLGEVPAASTTPTLAQNVGQATSALLAQLQQFMNQPPKSTQPPAAYDPWGQQPTMPVAPPPQPVQASQGFLERLLSNPLAIAGGLGTLFLLYQGKTVLGLAAAGATLYAAGMVPASVTQAAAALTTGDKCAAARAECNERYVPGSGCATGEYSCSPCAIPPGC